MPFATLRKRLSEKPLPSGSGGVTRLGRDCAAKRGITLTQPRVRFGRARHWVDVDGQLDLFDGDAGYDT